MPSMDTALVLVGGGSLGAVQVGMLQALVEQRVPVDLVLGSSVGAINGAYFAARPTAAGLAELAAIWRGLRQADVFPFSLRDTAAALLHQRSHILHGEALGRLIRRVLPISLLEQAQLPLHVLGADLLSGESVLLSSGAAEPALLASCAIPLVFPAVDCGGRLLVDGGVASHTPIANAVALGARRILVLPTGVGCACRTPPRGLVAMALHALNLLSMRQLVSDIELYAAQASIHVVAPLCPLDVSVFDFSRSDQLLSRARRHTLDWLAAGGLLRTGVPGALQAHHHGAAHPPQHGAPPMG